MKTCIIKTPFGVTAGGEKVNAFTMQSGNITVCVIEYGAALQSVTVPDRTGKACDVVLGYDDLASYEAGTCSHGAIVGRFANRIKNAEVTINGIRYQLEKNSGCHHLHGVFGKRVFTGEQDGNAVVMRRICPAMEEGFPGTLTLTVRYTLENGALSAEYFAETDADTVLNITNHAFFNLNGHNSGDVKKHTLYLNSESYTETDGDNVPTGKILQAIGTPLDFSTEKEIGKDLFSSFPSIKLACGFDHNMIIRGAAGTLRKAATLTGDKSGIKMNVYTTQPAAQLYTANYVEQDAVKPGKCGAYYRIYGAVCIETQHYPASPAYPHFPTTLLKRGERFYEKTVWQFSV